MIGNITTVWGQVMQWVTESLGDVQIVFYDATANGGEGALTFLGVLAIISTSIGLALLLVGIIQNFLHLRS